MTFAGAECGLQTRRRLASQQFDSAFPAFLFYCNTIIVAGTVGALDALAIIAAIYAYAYVLELLSHTAKETTTTTPP